MLDIDFAGMSNLQPMIVHTLKSASLYDVGSLIHCDKFQDPGIQR